MANPADPHTATISLDEAEATFVRKPEAPDPKVLAALAGAYEDPSGAKFQMVLKADVTVLVADLVGFTTLSNHINPELVVHLLNEVFSAFDLLVEKHGLEKIKTVGDAYMVAGGLSLPRPDHAEACAELAVHLRKEISRHNWQNDSSIRLKVGICTGPVVAGVIGRERFAYDLWGETVNLACRLESTASAGWIQVSESTYERLKEKYQFEKRHNTGLGHQDNPPAYWLGDRIGQPFMPGMNGTVAA